MTKRYVIIIPSRRDAYCKPVVKGSDLELLRLQKVGCITKGYIVEDSTAIMFTDASKKPTLHMNYKASFLRGSDVMGRVMVAKWADGGTVAGFTQQEAMRILAKVNGGRYEPVR